VELDQGLVRAAAPARASVQSGPTRDRIARAAVRIADATSIPFRIVFKLLPLASLHRHVYRIYRADLRFRHAERA